MRHFKLCYTFGSGLEIYAITGGFLLKSNGTINAAWTQSRLVLMFIRAGSPAEEVWVDVTAGRGDIGEITVPIRISLDYSDVQYCDITDILRSVILRKKSISIYDTGTEGYISISTRLHDGSIVDKDVYEGKFSYYDAIVMNPVSLQPASLRLLPETFRLPLSYTEPPYVCTRMTRGAIELIIYDSNGQVVQNWGPGTDHRTYGWGFGHAGEIASVVLKGHGGAVVEKSRVIWEDCASDKVLLRWWSPVFGGWKAVLADVLGHANSIGDTADFLLGREVAGKGIRYEWGFEQAKSGTIVYKVRIPSCTSRDYDYYSDIYISDEVYIEDVYVYSTSGAFDIVNHTVKVSGTPPAKPLNGVTDLELTITTQEVSSIW